MLPLQAGGPGVGTGDTGGDTGGGGGAGGGGGVGTGVPAQLTRLPASLLIRSSTPARGMCPGQRAAAGDMETWTLCSVLGDTEDTGSIELEQSFTITEKAPTWTLSLLT